jgi:hypothetical protein
MDLTTQNVSHTSGIGDVVHRTAAAGEMKDTKGGKGLLPPQYTKEISKLHTGCNGHLQTLQANPLKESPLPALLVGRGMKELQCYGNRTRKGEHTKRLHRPRPKSKRTIIDHHPK